MQTDIPLQLIPQDMLRKYIMYAREKVRPKLYDLDQEKISRLFADLRRESLATGSYPITVRHLESVIRMSEASAKMALREYVRADDIDLAITVTVGSFVNAQKMSIKKTLERVCLVEPETNVLLLIFNISQSFRKYLTQARDHEELLAFLLGQIVKEKVRLFQLQRHQQPESVTVKVAELDERVSRIQASSRAVVDVLCTGQGTRHLRHCAVPPVEAVYRERVQTPGRRHREEVPAC